VRQPLPVGGKGSGAGADAVEIVDGRGCPFADGQVPRGGGRGRRPRTFPKVPHGGPSRRSVLPPRWRPALGRFRHTLASRPSSASLPASTSTRGRREAGGLGRSAPGPAGRGGGLGSPSESRRQTARRLNALVTRPMARRPAPS
jgi:hypothetical protein